MIFNIHTFISFDDSEIRRSPPRMLQPRLKQYGDFDYQPQRVRRMTPDFWLPSTVCHLELQ